MQGFDYMAWSVVGLQVSLSTDKARFTLLQHLQCGTLCSVASFGASYCLTHPFVIRSSQDAHLIMSLQVFGGLIVGMVVKYADNILKNFANALSVIFTVAGAVPLFHQYPSGWFILGLAFVMLSICMYGKSTPVVSIQPRLSCPSAACLWPDVLLAACHDWVRCAVCDLLTDLSGKDASNVEADKVGYVRCRRVQSMLSCC